MSVLTSENLYKFIKGSHFYYEYCKDGERNDSELICRQRLLNLLFEMIDIEVLGYDQNIYMIEIDNHYSLRAFYEHAVAMLGNDTKEINVNPYIERTAFYHDIQILKNQPSTYYINVLKTFKHVYELVHDNEKIRLLVLSMWWLNRILTGRARLKEFDEDIRKIMNDKELNKDIYYVMTKQMEPHLVNLKSLMENDGDVDVDDILFDSLDKCLDDSLEYSPYDSYEPSIYGTNFKFIVPMYDILVDGILHPDTFHKTKLFRAFVTVLNDFFWSLSKW